MLSPEYGKAARAPGQRAQGMLAMKKLAAGLRSAEPKKFILKFFKAGGTRFLAFQSDSRATFF
jgi:hypothetical protein